MYGRYLLASILRDIPVHVEASVQIRELFTRQNHRNAHRREQTNKGQFDAAYSVGRSEASKLGERCVEAFAGGAFDIVGGDVVDCLRAVGEPQNSAIDRLADSPLERRFTFCGGIHTEDSGTHKYAEMVVPEAVEAVLRQQGERH